MSLARSFIKGDRWAFHHKDKLMACERCVWGTGKHTCGQMERIGIGPHQFVAGRDHMPDQCDICNMGRNAAIHR